MPIDLHIIKEFIRANLKNVRGVEDVASAHGIPGDTLRKDFVRKERIPLSDFIMMEKIEKMKSQLLETEAKCLTICLDVGLREDAGARIFKRIVRMTMEEFRQAHKSGGQGTRKKNAGGGYWTQVGLSANVNLYCQPQMPMEFCCFSEMTKLNLGEFRWQFVWLSKRIALDMRRGNGSRCDKYQPEMTMELC